MLFGRLPFPEACFLPYIPYGVDFDDITDTIVTLVKQKQNGV